MKYNKKGKILRTAETYCECQDDRLPVMCVVNEFEGIWKPKDI